MFDTMFVVLFYIMLHFTSSEECFTVDYLSFTDRDC